MSSVATVLLRSLSLLFAHFFLEPLDSYFQGNRFVDFVVQALGLLFFDSSANSLLDLTIGFHQLVVVFLDVFNNGIKFVASRSASRGG